MTREKLQQWLETQIRLYREFQANKILLTHDEEEYTCRLDGYTDGIHITHAKMVARFLGIPFEVADFRGGEYPYKVIFNYNGIRFFSLYTQEDFDNE